MIMFLARSVSLILVDWRKLGSKIGNNEESTNACNQ